MKKLTKKFIVILLISVLITITFISSTKAFVNPGNSKENAKEENITKNVEEKILKYDRKTDTTTEVDIEELEKILKERENSNKVKTYFEGSKTKISKITKNIPNILSANPTAERILDTSIAPYKYVGRIEAINSKQQNVYASGAIVGKKLALTAAHCVIDDNNEKLKNWVITAGYNFKDDKIYQSATTCGWDSFYYSSLYLSTHSAEYDWAICVLQANVGEELGNTWLGGQAYGTSDEMLNLPVTMMGYPADENYGFVYNGIYQYKTSGNIIDADSYNFEFNGLGFGGFSGSPIVRSSDNVIVGVLRGNKKESTGDEEGDVTRPVGVRITQAMVDIINSES